MHHIKRAVVCLCALAVCVSLQPRAAAAEQSRAQGLGDTTLILSGTVSHGVTLTVTVQAEDGSPLSGARVWLQEESNVTTTNVDGRVWLTGLLPRNTYQIGVTLAGYQDWNGTYVCPAAAQNGETLTITLLPEVSLPPQPPAPPVDPPGGSGSGGEEGESGGSSGGGDLGGPSGGGPGGSIIVIPDLPQPGMPGGDPTGGNGGETPDQPNRPTRPGQSGGNTASPGSGTTAEDENDPGPGSGGPEVVTRPPMQVTAPEGSNRIPIPRPDMEASLLGRQDILLVYPQGSPVRVPAFDQHDLDLIGSGTVTVTRTEHGDVLTITVPKEETPSSSAGLPHNLISTVLTGNMDMEIEFEDDPAKNFRLTAQQTAQIVPENGDLLFAYDRAVESGYLIYEVQSAVHAAAEQAVIPAAAFALAKERGLGLKCRVYDPETGLEVWYEWVFSPAALQNAVPADTDLRIHGVPEAGDPILTLMRGVACQYIITNHHGSLPAEAVLRVKNLSGFPAEEKLALLWADGERLETVCTGLTPDEDGWYEWKMSHCSSYALAAEKDLAALGGRGGGVKHLLAVLVCLLGLAWLLLLLLRRRREEPETPIRMDAQPGSGQVIDTNWEDINDHEREQTRTE